MERKLRYILIATASAAALVVASIVYFKFKKRNGNIQGKRSKKQGSVNIGGLRISVFIKSIGHLIIVKLYLVWMLVERSLR